MEKPKINKTELALQQAMRDEGWLVPVTETEVEIAEKAFDAEKPQLPSSLLKIPKLERRILESSFPQFLRTYWTHHSVLNLTRTNNPVDVIAERARNVVMQALENGWNGPPYDPFELAEIRGIRLVPTQDVVDARTTANASGRFTVEFNPTRPPARINYSIAHEIAHTLFSDCAQAVRHRGTHSQMAPDEWQLEMLCNVAASEILMPFGSLAQKDIKDVSVDSVWDLRKRYRVSSEAVLLRLTRLTTTPCIAFAARRAAEKDDYYIDYSLASRTSRNVLTQGFKLPRTTKAHECTAIGWTAKGREHWIPSLHELNIEYLGIPPYLGQLFPRVLGIALPTPMQAEAVPQITYLRGDARNPRGVGNRLILQLVNDKALTWGAGFAKAVREKWPELQSKFTAWVQSRDSEFRLGGIHVAEIEPTLHLVSLVAQHGYGPSPKPRIRYRALMESLEKVAALAQRLNASIHMPRIGEGQSRGSWDIVREIVDQAFCSKSIDVFVYELPDSKRFSPQQPALQFRGSEGGS